MNMTVFKQNINNLLLEYMRFGLYCIDDKTKFIPQVKIASSTESIEAVEFDMSLAYNGVPLNQILDCGYFAVWMEHCKQIIRQIEDDTMTIGVVFKLRYGDKSYWSSILFTFTQGYDVDTRTARYAPKWKGVISLPSRSRKVVLQNDIESISKLLCFDQGHRYRNATHLATSNPMVMVLLTLAGKTCSKTHNMGETFRIAKTVMQGRRNMTLKEIIDAYVEYMTVVNKMTA